MLMTERLTRRQPLFSPPFSSKTGRAAAKRNAEDAAAAAAAAEAAANVYYADCDAVRAAGADPIRAGDPAYSTKLDRDGDGIGCEK